MAFAITATNFCLVVAVLCSVVSGSDNVTLSLSDSFPPVFKNSSILVYCDTNPGLQTANLSQLLFYSTDANRNYSYKLERNCSSPSPFAVNETSNFNVSWVQVDGPVQLRWVIDTFDYNGYVFQCELANCITKDLVKSSNTVNITAVRIPDTPVVSGTTAVNNNVESVLNATCNGYVTADGYIYFEWSIKTGPNTTIIITNSFNGDPTTGYASGSGNLTIIPDRYSSYSYLCKSVNRLNPSKTIVQSNVVQVEVQYQPEQVEVYFDNKQVLASTDGVFYINSTSSAKNFTCGVDSVPASDVSLQRTDQSSAENTLQAKQIITTSVSNDGPTDVTYTYLCNATYASTVTPIVSANPSAKVVINVQGNSAATITCSLALIILLSLINLF